MASLEVKKEIRQDPSMDVPDLNQSSSQPIQTDQNAQVAQNPIKPKSIQIEISPEMQDILVEIVLDDYAKAQSDREKKDYGITSKGETLRFTDWIKRIRDLYNGTRIPKTIPWKFCSNRSMRIAASILDMMHARLYPSVWNEDMCRWRAGTILDVNKTERISKFMDWWIRVHAPLRRFFDSWVKNTAGYGDSLVESCWDIEERATSQTIEIPITDEMGQPLINQDGSPAVDSQPYIEREERTKSRIIPKDKVFFMEGARDIQRDPVLIEEDFLFKDLEEMEKRGIAVNVIGNDSGRPTVEKMTVVPEPSGNVDPEDKERIRRIKLRNMPVKVVREYLHYDIDGSGFSQSIRIMIDPEHKIYLGAVKMSDVTYSGKRPLSFDKFDDYIDRLEDLDGEGVLNKVRELSDEVDAIFNQITDAHTLAVLRPFFYDPSGDIDAPAMQLGPNKGIPVTDPVRNVYFPPIEIPTERLMNAIRLVLEFIERLTAASSYIMGKESDVSGGSGTATRTNAIVQSAEIRFSLPSERLRAGAANILTQHLDLIQLNIPPGMEKMVLGEKGEQIFKGGELSDIALSGKFSAYLLPDPSMGSKQTERELMSMLYSMLLQNMIVGTDPKKIYAVTADFLRSYGKDPQRYLGPAPSEDDIMDPEDENTLMIRGDFQRVSPEITENHIYHIQKHMDLLKSPSFLALSQEAPELAMQIQEFNQMHIQQHMQMMQSMMALMQKYGGKVGENGIEGNTSPNDPGGKPAGNPGTQKNATQFSMETVKGPLGEALNAKREGQVGQSQTA